MSLFTVWAKSVPFVVGVAVLILSSVLNVTGKKACMQNGIGPSDLYKNGKMNPSYMWYRVGRKVQVPVVLDHAYCKLLAFIDEKAHSFQILIR
jgi:hypothetical protein